MERLEAGHHAVGDVGVEEGGVLRGDHDVGLAQEVEGTAAGHAVDRRHDRLPQVVLFRVDAAARVVVLERGGHEARGVLALPLVGAHVLEVALLDALVPVDARAEGLVPGSGQDDGPHRIVSAQGPPELAQLFLHLLVEGVVHLGPIERDDGDAVVLLVAKCLERSLQLSLPP